jgi:hypothetical protein
MSLIYVKWRERVVAAAHAYGAAKTASEKAMRERKDLSCIPEDSAVEEALHVENLALQRYREALDRFTRLVLDGVEPPDDA